MRSIKASVKNVYVHGQKVQSAICTQSTKPIFRSESARYVLFIQMSKEMWDFDTGGSGEIMFSRVINGFLPELFKRWQQMNVRHLITVVLFTRLQYETAPAQDAFFSHPKKEDTVERGLEQQSDFYRVVVSDVSSGGWPSILEKLKYEFKNFLRDVSIRRPDSGIRTILEGGLPSAADVIPQSVISGRPSVAARGNILEAINLASLQFSYDHIDRDLVRTGVSIAVITPGTGVFEVNHDLLVMTTENLIANGIGIDLVCLARMPLHSVPLFKYRQNQGEDHREATEEVWNSESVWPGVSRASSVNDDARDDQRRDTEGQSSTWCYGIPHWIDVSFWTSAEDNLTQVANLPIASDRRRKPFRPRVRMYELQMLGVTEDAMNHISIPHMTSIRRALAMATEFEGVGGASPKSSLITFDQDDMKPHSLRSTLGISPKRQVIATPTSREIARYTLDHDESVFIDSHNGEQLPATRSSRVDHHGLAKASTPPRSSDSHKDSATFADRVWPKSSLSGAERDARPGAMTPCLEAIKANEAGNSTESVNKDSKARLGPSRRQISFGPRGFGIGTAKATPSTELTAEHAKPQSALSQNLRMQIPDNGVTASSTVSSGPKTVITSMSTKSVLSDRDVLEQSQSQSSDSEAQSLSRPIPIRHATAFRVSKDRDGGISNEYKRMPTDSKPKHDQLSPPDSEHGLLLTKGTARRKATMVSAQSRPNSVVKEDPWLTVLNPSNPQANINLLSRLGRWHHVFPRPLRASKIRWKSLCAPAAIPSTVEETPMPDSIYADHEILSYQISVPSENVVFEAPHLEKRLILEMVSLRLSHGYQIVLRQHHEGLDVYGIDQAWVDGAIVELSKGSSIHKLQYLNEKGIQVTCFVRRPVGTAPHDGSYKASTLYKPSIRAMFANTYDTREIKVSSHHEDLNWKEMDGFIAGRTLRQPTDLTEGLQPWCARFVLIPVDPPVSHRRVLQPLNEDNEEEIRLEGIRKLTQIWQRFRYASPDERRFQSSARKSKDTNPLDIMYQTRNPSLIIAAEKDLVAEHTATGKPVELLPESELLQRSNISLSSLAQIIQSAKGVRMMDRRWHWRLHYNCFIGFELTSWLLQNFRDINSRDEAVELGNDLMTSGLFQHVEKRHNFRDGNFFYQMAGDYRTPRSEVKTWYGSRKSVPPTPTPLREDGGKDFPGRPSSGVASNTGEEAEANQEKTTIRSSMRGPEYRQDETSADEKRTLGVALSRSMLYDVDHRKRSYRPELVHLHYDRLHNPDNCYHIRIEWMTVTSKLIEDAIVSWATSVERYGLRLVEVPLAEACQISDKQPFRAPYPIVLARQPPNKQPEHQTSLGVGSFTTGNQAERNFYQKSLLKRLDYVLDFEAATDFPPDVDVSYSWGKPDYKYSQYIHRSGMLLAQITGDGNFILLANRLYNIRSAVNQHVSQAEDNELYHRKSHAARAASYRGSPRASPFSSPMIRPKSETPLPPKPGLVPIYTSAEELKDEFERFCHDEMALEKFYDEMLNKAPLPERRTPYLHSTIPNLGLPPSLSLGRESSAASSGPTGAKMEEA